MIGLYPATLIRRYQRFLADVRLSNGDLLTIHCPNTGSMKHCIVPESPCWYSVSTRKTRKYPQTLEVVTTPTGHWAGINTGRANMLVEAALELNTIAELQGYALLHREVTYGGEGSRIDFVLDQHEHDPRVCYLEVKSVTLLEHRAQGFFPDAVSTRATKHLRELINMVKIGHRAVLLFCVQHTGIESVSPATHIDPLYGEQLRTAIRSGVEILAYKADINPARGVIQLSHRIEVQC